MYHITKKQSGFIIKFSGEVTVDEVLDFYNDSNELLGTNEEGFGLILIMNKTVPFGEHQNGIFKTSLQLFKEKGLERMAIIQNNEALQSQIAASCKALKISNTERFIDSTSDNAVDLAIDWVKYGKEPVETTNQTHLV